MKKKVFGSGCAGLAYDHKKTGEIQIIQSMTKQVTDQEVVITYLQMLDPVELNPFTLDDPRIRVERAHDCPASFFRYLYAEVGRDYHWVERLGWTDEEIQSYLGDSNIALWLLTYAGSPAGYFELRKWKDGSTEIAYFGLLPEFIGRGLGKHLLTRAIEEAWATNPDRVWLHTCTLDDPAAMPNYLKRGLKPFKEEKRTLGTLPG